MKFVFVILNYNSICETIECIKSIQKINYNDKKIVVVDNNSMDKIKLIESICTIKHDNVSILRTYENIGYARGNNVGMDYSRNKLHADFVCVINPDTVILNENFIDSFIQHYVTYKYSIAGPDILENNIHINPLGGYHEDKCYFLKEGLNSLKISIVKKYSLGKFNIFKKKNSNDDSLEINKQNFDFKTKLLERHKTFMLSGACLVFSPLFFRKFSGFSNKTFLYNEENILAIVCNSFNGKLLFNGDVSIRHIGGKSSKNEQLDDNRRISKIQKIGAKSDFVVFKILMHRNNNKYLINILNPIVDKYEVLFK